MRATKKRWKLQAKGVKVDVVVDIGKAIDGWTWGDAVTAASVLMHVAREILDAAFEVRPRSNKAAS